MALATVLLIEDEPGIADTVIYALETEGYVAHWASTGADGLRLAQSVTPDLVVLDIGLPDMSGFDVFRHLDRDGSAAVIFLTARAEEVDRVIGLEMGADDYMVKPFSPRELTARIRAVLRRAQSGSSGVQRHIQDVDHDKAAKVAEVFGPFHIDSARWVICYRDQELDLTRHEYDLLTTLVRAQGEVFSRGQLLQENWHAPDHRLDRTVDVHVKNIRAKLRDIDRDHDPIKTKRGIGYYADWKS